MTYRPLLYISLAAIGGLSFFGALLLPVDETAKLLTALPFVGSLFAALFQVLRDYSSFQKEALLQQREQAFVIAATSHMSEVVFDKHVEFSEAYIDALQDILGKLFAKGPTEEAMHYTDPLRVIRRKYRLWLSPSMAGALEQFEHRVIEMGGAFSLGRLPERSSTEQHIAKAYDLFKEILNLEKQGENGEAIKDKKEQGYAAVIAHLQNILGVEKLTNLRDKALGSAIRQ